MTVVLPVCFQDKIALDVDFALLTAGKVVDLAAATSTILRRRTARFRCQQLIRAQRNGGGGPSGGSLVRANG